MKIILEEEDERYEKNELRLLVSQDAEISKWMEER